MLVDHEKISSLVHLHFLGLVLIEIFLCNLYSFTNNRIVTQIESHPHNQSKSHLANDLEFSP